MLHLFSVHEQSSGSQQLWPWLGPASHVQDPLMQRCSSSHVCAPDELVSLELPSSELPSSELPSSELPSSVLPSPSPSPPPPSSLQPASTAMARIIAVKIRFMFVCPR